MYKGFYGADYRAMIERVAANADSPQLTTNAIVEAITSWSWDEMWTWKLGTHF